VKNKPLIPTPASQFALPHSHLSKDVASAPPAFFILLSAIRRWPFRLPSSSWLRASSRQSQRMTPPIEGTSGTPRSLTASSSTVNATTASAPGGTLSRQTAQREASWDSSVPGYLARDSSSSAWWMTGWPRLNRTASFAGRNTLRPLRRSMNLSGSKTSPGSGPLPIGQRRVRELPKAAIGKRY